MPRAIKKKTAKKETLDSEAQVRDRLEDLREGFRKKQKTVVAYGALVLGAIIVVGGIAVFRYTSVEKAKQLEYEAFKVYEGLYQTTPLTRPEQAQKALDLFQQAYAKKKSAPVLLYIADAYAELGKYDEALKSLDDFAKRYSREESLLPLAYQKMGAMYLKKGNQEEAIKSFAKITQAQGDVLKDYALIATGRILEEQGKHDEAKAKYKELTEKFPRSPFFEEATARLGGKKAG